MSNVKLKEKNLAIAICLNLVIPGIGYMYMESWIMSICGLFFAAYFLIIVPPAILPMWLILNVIMIIDMIKITNKRKKLISLASTKRCPNCAEFVQREARICRFCNTKFVNI
jgi:hypothetical protein